MATLHFDEHSTISVGGIDLSGLVGRITFDPEPTAAHMQEISSTLDGLRPASIQFSGMWDGPPLLPEVERSVIIKIRPKDMRRWRAWWRRSRPQITRMRAAYGRRRGRGRW